MTVQVTTMTAVVQEVYGLDPEVVLSVAEVPRPTIGDGEVLVRVAASSVDRGTWHLMTGLAYPIRLAGFGLRRPKALNPGRNLAGVVEAVGRDVTGFAVGDEVYGTGENAFAEYARTTPQRLAPLPRNLSAVDAATVPVSGVTALRAVRDQARVRAGESVLVLGASGGVGTFAVQLARHLGAQVTGVCSTAKLDVVRGLGVERAVDYTREDPVDGSVRYDVILDIGGNRPLSHLRRALAPRGRLVLVGGEDGGNWLGGMDRSLRAALLSPFVSQSLTAFIAWESGADLAALTGFVEAGSVTPVVERAYPLAETGAAIAHLAAGRARGKLAVTI